MSYSHIKDKDGLTVEINISWCADDVRCVAQQKGVRLRKKEISNILDALWCGHDASMGINWDTIDHYIERALEDRGTK